MSGKASISVMFTKNCESIRLMFEYQTTGTHLMLFCAEVLLVNAREELCGCVCVGGALIHRWVEDLCLRAPPLFSSSSGGSASSESRRP